MNTEQNSLSFFLLLFSLLSTSIASAKIGQATLNIFRGGGKIVKDKFVVEDKRNIMDVGKTRLKTTTTQLFYYMTHGIYFSR